MKKNLQTITEEILDQEALLKEGGGEKGKKRQERHGRMVVRERLAHLLDEEDAGGAA